MSLIYVHYFSGTGVDSKCLYAGEFLILWSEGHNNCDRENVVSLVN